MISKSKKRIQLSKKMMVISLLFVLLFQSFVPSTLLSQVGIVEAAGTGTTTDPIQISTVQDLKAMLNGLDKHYVLKNDIDFGTSYYWLPIGTATTPFKGSFNGNGYKIKNLLIDRPMDNQGLFGYTLGAKIENLALENVNIQGINNVGALVGYATSGTEIKNCSTSGSINGSGDNIGGLIGFITSISTATSKITECANYGSVKGVNNVGGVAGYLNNYAELLNCYNRGNISGSKSNVGGITGYIHSSNAKYCYSSGEVTGVSNVGGLVGAGYGGSLNHSFALSSKVTATSSAGSRVIAAKTPGSSLINNYAYEDMVVTVAGAVRSIKLANPVPITDGYNIALSKLKTNATYYESEGWDYNSVWKFVPDGFPVLQNQVPKDVEQVVKVTAVTLDISTESMKVGDTTTLNATISPANATNKAITWSSSNTDIVTISNSGFVTAKAAGTATIIVTAQDGGFTGECNITVVSESTVGKAPINLALNQYASADSVSSSNSAQKALDGDPTTRWTAKTNTTNVNFTIGFPQEIKFEQIQIKEHSNRITNFKLQYFNGSEFEDFYVGTTMGDNFILDMSDFITSGPITTSKINLLVVSTKDPLTGGASIFEFGVYGTKSDAPLPTVDDNLALNMTATASVVSGSYQAKNAVDGNAATRWLATNYSVGAWLEIDFGKMKTFNSVKLQEAHARVSSYEIQYFNGAEWVTCYRGNTIGTDVTAKFDAVEAAKVRLLVTGLIGQNGASIAEIAVYHIQ
jgi:hypothetical protein